MKNRKTIAFVAAALVIGAVVGAGAAGSVMRSAGPVEVRVVETIGSTDYYTLGRFSTISAALASITDASPNKPYVIFLPPGVYDLGGAQVAMKPYVDIVGSGEDVAAITCVCGSDLNEVDGATLLGADNATLRDVTVRNTGGGQYVTAFADLLTGTRLESVTIQTWGGTQMRYGILTYGSESATYNDVDVLLLGGGTGMHLGGGTLTATNINVDVGGGGWGIRILTNYSTFRNVTVWTHGGLSDNVGMFVDSANVTLENITTTGTGGQHGVGMHLSSTAHITLRNVAAHGANGTLANTGLRLSGASPGLVLDHITATAWGGGNAYGVMSSSSSGTFQYLTADGAGASGDNYGYYFLNSGGGMRVLHSSLSGTTNSLNSEATADMFYIGATMLDGPVVASPGWLICVETFDATFTALDENCNPPSPLLPPSAEAAPPAEPPLLPAPGE